MISILLPTMHRKNLLERAINSLFETTDDYNIELITIIDEDQESYETVQKLYDKWYSPKRIFITRFNTIRIGALNALNMALRMSTGDILFPYGDDGFCHPRWLDYALETHHNRLHDYGCVGLNDGAYNGNIQVATTLLFDRNFCKNIFGGVVGIPVYKYYCVDLELNERAKRINAFYWDERAIVEHMHSAHGKRPIDIVDQYKIDSNWMEQDNILFTQRKEQGFPNNFEAII